VNYVYSYDTLGARGEGGAWPHGGGGWGGWGVGDQVTRPRPLSPGESAQFAVWGGAGGAGSPLATAGGGGGGGMEGAMLYGEEADFWMQRQQALAVLEQRVLQVCLC
jgi:hypothetical protein